MPEPLVLETRGESETRAVGRRLARELRGGERIGLSGELGAGKTCFVRGLAEGLGIPPHRVRSPSFLILLPYDGGRLPLYHIDLFRLPEADIDLLGLREVLYGDGVCAIEWFDRLREPLENFLEVSLTFVGPETRRLVAVRHGVGYHQAMAALQELAS
jgi:tRNA threonylcarbamoyladenosine biosynthesis protein TsaE